MHNSVTLGCALTVTYSTVRHRCIICNDNTIIASHFSNNDIFLCKKRTAIIEEVSPWMLDANASVVQIIHIHDVKSGMFDSTTNTSIVQVMTYLVVYLFIVKSLKFTLQQDT